MSDETGTMSEVARVLIDHTRIDGIHGDCLCKHVVPLGHSFAAHQAAMLAEAGLLRDQATIDALNERCRILVDEGDRLRAQIATQEPAGATQGGSAGKTTPADHWEHQRPWHVIEMAEPPTKDAP